MTTPFARGDFHKSTFSEPDKNCVEVAQGQSVVEVRDSKTPFGSTADTRLQVSHAGFSAFLETIGRRGEL